MILPRTRNCRRLAKYVQKHILGSSVSTYFARSCFCRSAVVGMAEGVLDVRYGEQQEGWTKNHSFDLEGVISIMDHACDTIVPRPVCALFIRVRLKMIGTLETMHD